VQVRGATEAVRVLGDLDDQEVVDERVDIENALVASEGVIEGVRQQHSLYFFQNPAREPLETVEILSRSDAYSNNRVRDPVLSRCESYHDDRGYRRLADICRRLDATP
jgi:hypothetical protein